MRTLGLMLTIAMTCAGTTFAQQPATPPPAAPSAAPTAAPAPVSPMSPTMPATSPDTYTYQPDGRRDPFVSVLGSGVDPRPTSKRGDGPAGMLTAEISVRGIMQNGGGLTALVQGPDAKTYLMRANDKLMDGTVKAVTPEGLTIVQDVNDPLSLVKTREVRKPLRPAEGLKP